jgi:hypothetical protein
MSNTPRPSRKNTLSDHGSVVEDPGASEDGRPPNNLPLELSSFVGRSREIAEVGELLRAAGCSPSPDRAARVRPVWPSRWPPG